MIRFDGIDLEDVAPVKIENILVSPIQIQPVTRQRFTFGQDLIRTTGSFRTVTVTFALPVDDINERFALLEQIAEWAKPYKICTLNLPMHEDRHLECMCTKYPDPSYREWWESRLTLVFTTFDNPYWTSDEEITAQCGTQFSIGGSAPPLMSISRRLTSKVANQTYASGGKSMFFEQIPAGNLLIDLNRQTAEVSGNSIMQYFGKTSKFIEPVTGNVVITGVGSVTYRERWV